MITNSLCLPRKAETGDSSQFVIDVSPFRMLRKLCLCDTCCSSLSFTSPVRVSPHLYCTLDSIDSCHRLLLVSILQTVCVCPSYALAPIALPAVSHSLCLDKDSFTNAALQLTSPMPPYLALAPVPKAPPSSGALCSPVTW